jgi:hypothetical protein
VELSPALVKESDSDVPAFRGKMASSKLGDGVMGMGSSVKESGNLEFDPKPIISKAIPPLKGSQCSKNKSQTQESNIESTVSQQLQAKGKE